MKYSLWQRVKDDAKAKNLGLPDNAEIDDPMVAQIISQIDPELRKEIASLKLSLGGVGESDPGTYKGFTQKAFIAAGGQVGGKRKSKRKSKKKSKKAKRKSKKKSYRRRR